MIVMPMIFLSIIFSEPELHKRSGMKSIKTDGDTKIRIK